MRTLDANEYKYDGYSLNQALSAITTIRQFRTKQSALDYGKRFGWNVAIRVAKRFETVWVVGKEDFQEKIIAGIAFNTAKLPLFTYRNGTMETIEVKRIKEGQTDENHT